MTPLSVYLPFNVDCLRGDFTPAKRGGGPPAGRGRWLVVQDQKLLVAPEGEGFRLPEGREPGAPPRGLESIGTRFWLGTWHGEPCWVAARPKDAPVPEGLAAETLVPMQGTRLPDELRSGERRVGKECRTRWAPDDEKEKRQREAKR